jgi:hypothetical protein
VNTVSVHAMQAPETGVPPSSPDVLPQRFQLVIELLGVLSQAATPPMKGVQ